MIVVDGRAHDAERLGSSPTSLIPQTNQTATEPFFHFYFSLCSPSLPVEMGDGDERAAVAPAFRA